MAHQAVVPGAKGTAHGAQLPAAGAREEGVGGIEISGVETLQDGVVPELAQHDERLVQPLGLEAARLTRYVIGGALDRQTNPRLVGDRRGELLAQRTVLRLVRHEDHGVRRSRPSERRFALQRPATDDRAVAGGDRRGQ